MQRLYYSLLFCLLDLGGCRTSGSNALESDQEVFAEKTPVGGTLSVIVIPPALNVAPTFPADISWESPNDLFKTSAASKAAGIANTHSIERGPFRLKSKATLAHPIGHFHIKLECANGVSVPLTGQTGGGSEYGSVLDGVGASFRIFDGNLDDETPAALQSAMNDYNKRLESGYMAMMRFKVSAENCQHMADFLAEYKRRGANRFYGGQFRPRRFEGSGCSAFGLAFIEVGGLLRRSLYTKDWAQNVMIGLGRISNIGGRKETSQKLVAQGLGDFKYGSNLLAYDANGKMLQWPKKQNVVVDASQHGAIRPLSPWMTHWADADPNSATNDHSVNKLPEQQPDVIPWTIYDPQLVYHWIKDINRRIKTTNASVEAYERVWTATQEGAADVIETDATDAKPQPFFDPTDDLRKDPDYEHPDATDTGRNPTDDLIHRDLKD